jgi:hypothetical protein
MNYQVKFLIRASLCAAALMSAQAATPAAASKPADPLDACNVVWNTPSENAQGSMPLGNGDVGINAWVEANGDLVFYVSKTDAWDENARLCKIGRVRVKFDPPLAPKDGFRQELKLRDGVIQIQSTISNQQSTILLWVDADKPVVRVDAQSAVPVSCRAEVELWRLGERSLDKADEYGYGTSNKPLAQAYKLTMLPDVVVTSALPQVLWYHRNTRSLYPVCLKVQHLEMLEGQFVDPLLNHTFGASMRGADMVPDGPKALKSAKPATRHQLSVCVLAERAATPDAWLKDLDRVEKAALSEGNEQSRLSTSKWWQTFWNRSWVFAEEYAVAAIPANAHPLTVGADSKGENRFRGEIAAAAIHERVLSPAELLDRKPPALPDKHPREVAPAKRTWPNGLTMEAWVRCAPQENGRIFDKCTPGQRDGFLLDVSGSSLRLIFDQESLLAMDCLKPGQWQHVAVTLGRPRLDGWTIYVDGKVVATRDAEAAFPPEVTKGYVLQRFMNACSGHGASPIKFNGSIFTVEKTPGASLATADGENITTEAQRTRWARILRDMPPLPVAEVDGVKLLRASTQGAEGSSENPELYAVFPYRLFGVGKPDLGMACATYDKRNSRINTGWGQDSIQAACLGLRDEASRLVAIRARINQAYRFPAMWSGFDWIPDQNHGDNILTTLQFMLLQSDGRKIYVLPAWPKNWDVSFKLHAPYNTTVEGIYKAGKLEKLTVTPESRAADVVNMLEK